MNKRVYKQDIAAGIAVIMLGIAAFGLALDMPGKASMFPKVVSCILVVLGVLLGCGSMIRLRNNTPTEDQAVALGALKGPAVVLLLLMLYVMAVIYLGFYISTPVMLVSYMFLLGIRSLKTIAIATALVMIFIYCLFTMQLGVPLPAGLLG